MRRNRHLERIKSGRRAFARQFRMLVLILLIPSVVEATPTVLYRTEYYEIRGSTAAQLRAQMNKRGLRDAKGVLGDALTRWRINWHFDYKKNRSGCTIESVKSTVEITYIFPRWADRSEGSSELRAKWSDFISALTAHEEGHRDLAVSAAARIERAIKIVKERRNCEDLDRAANAMGQSILDELRIQNAEYDAQTGHGLTQGTKFP